MQRKVLEEFLSKQTRLPPIDPGAKFYYLSVGTLYHSQEYKDYIDSLLDFFKGELIFDNDFWYSETDTCHYKVRIDDDVA